MTNIFDDNKLYSPEDPELRIFGSKDKLAQWRYFGRGPAFYKIEKRIRYDGRDLNAYLQAQRVDPSVNSKNGA
jgi:hypothetical protein